MLVLYNINKQEICTNYVEGRGSRVVGRGDRVGFRDTPVKCELYIGMGILWGLHLLRYASSNTQKEVLTKYMF